MMRLFKGSNWGNNKIMSNRLINYSLILYIITFFVFLFGPLIIMSITAFNSADFPRISLGTVLVLDGLMKVW